MNKKLLFWMIAFLCLASFVSATELDLQANQSISSSDDDSALYYFINFTIVNKTNVQVISFTTSDANGYVGHIMNLSGSVPSTLVKSHATGSVDDVGGAAHNEWQNITFTEAVVLVPGTYAFHVVRASGGRFWGASTDYNTTSTWQKSADNSSWSDVAQSSMAFHVWGNQTAAPPAPVAGVTTLLLPTDNTHFNTDAFNVTFNTTITGDPTCNLYVNNQLNDTVTFNSSSGNASMTAVDLNELSYTFYVNCYNATYGNNTANRTAVIDLTSPTIIDSSGVNNTHTTEQTVKLNMTVGTDYLYKVYVNATCDGTNVHTNGTTLDGSWQNYIINDTIDHSTCANGSTVNVRIQAADTHTAKKIKPIPFNKNSADKKLKFNPSMPNQLDIYPSDPTVFSDVIVTKEFDRHSFEYKRDKSSNSYDYFYIEGENLERITKGKYKDLGHFVQWNGIGNNYWVDFNNDRNYPVSIKEISDTLYEVKVECKKDKCELDYKFNSIGGLNENEINITYVFDNSNLTLTTAYTDPVIEGNLTMYKLNITFNQIRYDVIRNVIFMHNATNYTIDRISNGSVTATEAWEYYEYNFSVPNGTGINSTIFPHKWYVNISNTTTNLLFNASGQQVIDEIIFDNCSLTDHRVLNIYFYNASSTTQALIADMEIAVDYLTTAGWSKNHSTALDGVNNYGFCMYPTDQELWLTGPITYTYENVEYNYNLFNYSVNGTAKNLSLFITSGTAQVAFTVLDQDDNELEGVQVYVLAYDTGTNSYDTVEILTTDYQGVAIGNIVLNTQPYKFIIYQDGDLIFESTNTYITSTSRTFRINLRSDYFDEYDVSRGISSALTFNNATRDFQFTYSDNSGTIHWGCLKVIRRDITGDHMINETCTYSAASTIYVNIGNDTNEGSFVATGYVRFDTKHLLNTLIITMGEPFKVYNFEGMFVALFLTIALVGIGLFHPGAAIGFTAIAFIITEIIGVFQLGWMYMFTFVILSGILVWKLARNK